jgi:hypothetical protein
VQRAARGGSAVEASTGSGVGRRAVGPSDLKSGVGCGAQGSRRRRPGQRRGARGAGQQAPATWRAPWGAGRRAAGAGDLEVVAALVQSTSMGSGKADCLDGDFWRGVVGPTCKSRE